jgi:hypothetical protein
MSSHRRGYTVVKDQGGLASVARQAPLRPLPPFPRHPVELRFRANGSHQCAGADQANRGSKSKVASDSWVACQRVYHCKLAWRLSTAVRRSEFLRILSGQTEHRVITQPQTDTHATAISTQTERVLHDFVNDAVSHLSEVLKDLAPVFEDDTRWERGDDGHFRERKMRTRTLWPMLNEEWLRSLPGYQKCVECLKSDMIIEPHLDRLVGTSMSTLRLEADTILMSLMYAMLDSDGRLAFTDERFHSEWQGWVSLFGADQIPFKTVVPLPHLVIPEFPLQLNNELVLDRLTDDEVTRCYQVGVIRPQLSRFPLISREVAVGIRRIIFFPKLIRRGDEPHERPETGGEGSFGNRPLLRDDLVIDDVLSALRLFKHTKIRTAGHASWTDSKWLSAGVSFRVLGQWPYGGKFELSASEVSHFLDLWHMLEEGSARFGYSIHRFNLAFDRSLLADRIVDLVIAAEALFLSDLDEKYRGELRFRFALRAAKFIEHPDYSEHDIFRIMRQAYDARSAIVHGGFPRETGLPDNQSATLPTFIDAIEELVRIGLRKALSMKKDGKKMRQAEYWDTLVFSRPNPYSERAKTELRPPGTAPKLW